jgi:hypothetical protein
MKTFCKLLLPPIIIIYLNQIKLYLRYFKYKNALKKNSEFKNSKEGIVYVIANGPSLKNYEFSNFLNQDVIVMNHFQLHPRKSELRIVAHCIGEPSDCSTWQNPTEMICGVDAESYWLHISSVDYFEKEVKSEKIRKKINFYFPIYSYELWMGRSINLLKPTIRYESTAQMAISVAIFMGYKEIRLVGFDHDWLATRGVSPHFYKESEPKYSFDHSTIPYLDMILISKNLWECYYAIKKTAIKENISIVNYSQPSFLDVFVKNETS